MAPLVEPGQYAGHAVCGGPGGEHLRSGPAGEVLGQQVAELAPGAQLHEHHRAEGELLVGSGPQPVRAQGRDGDAPAGELPAVLVGEGAVEVADRVAGEPGADQPVRSDPRPGQRGVGGQLSPYDIGFVLREREGGGQRVRAGKPGGRCRVA